MKLSLKQLIGIIILFILVGIKISCFIEFSQTMHHTSCSSVLAMSDEDIKFFNAKFERYEGVKSGNQIKLLINEIRSNNATAKGAGEQEIDITAIKLDGVDQNYYEVKDELDKF